jgi:hypothetical protein
MSVLIDCDVIKILLEKENYINYSPLIDHNVLFDETKKILRAVEKYYEETNKNKIDLSVFVPWFTNKYYKNLSPDETQYYKNIFENIASIEYPDIKSTIDKLKQEKLWKELDFIRKNGFDIFQMKDLISKYESQLEKDNDEYFPNDFDKAFALSQRPDGLKWRLNGLNERLKPLVRGDAGIIYAYTNIGKTTFIISETSFMAQQLTGDKKVLYFNNEGAEERVVRALWCATLKKKSETLLTNPNKAIELYTQAMHGDVDRVMVFDVRGKGLDYVEKVCSHYDPGLIIIDQLDYLIPEKKRDTARPYQGVYERARDISNKNCPVLVASQASGNVVWFDQKTHQKQFKKYLDEIDLHWSRVDKQGACEFMIGIGKDVNYPNIRCISIPRVKEQGTKFYRQGNTHFDCNIDEERMLFED